MNLDGETNLKEKFMFNKEIDETSVKKFKGEVMCDSPNENLDEWDGNIHIENSKVFNCK